jgi:anti-sigma-K factor RskA
VSSGTDHRDFPELLAAYALGALPEEQHARVGEHLAECPRCRAELEWLRTAVDALPASVPQLEPRPELKASVMAIVESEAALLRAAGETADRPERDAPRRTWPSVFGLRPAMAGVLACVAVVVVGGIVLALRSGITPAPRTIRAELSGRARTAGARVSLRVTGAHAELVVRRLPAPAADHVLELWVQRGSAAPVPAGTFIVRSGSVVVGRSVRPGDHVLVTVEPGRGSSTPTTAPFIVAKA